MNDISLHFNREEFADRQQRAHERMAALDLEGILLFKFEEPCRDTHLTWHQDNGLSGCPQGARCKA